MKTLLLIPLLGFMQPAATARPCDSCDASVTNNATASSPRPPASSDGDVSAKKNSSAPSAPRAPAPKQHRPARPSYLFM